MPLSRARARETLKFSIERQHLATTALGERGESSKLRQRSPNRCHQTGITCRLRTCLILARSVSSRLRSFAFLAVISRVKNPLARSIHPSITRYNPRSRGPFFLSLSLCCNLSILLIIPTCRATRDPSNVMRLVIYEATVSEYYREYVPTTLRNVDSLIPR